MHISWLGSTGFRLQVKPFDKDVTVAIDPYKQKVGTSPRSLAPDIALFTRGEEDGITLSGDPFVLASPGECETHGVLVSAAQGHDPESTVVRVDAEQLSLGHLGCMKKQPTDKQLQLLSGVDILCVPTGNDVCFDPEQAVKAINAIEPRVVIPMAFKSDNDPKAKSVDDFIKEIGIKADPAEKKVILKKKDLPQEDMQVVLLTKE
jgi:L-ascorbate metabolism protein UlaG (beta-lactamase superfamily)